MRALLLAAAVIAAPGCHLLLGVKTCASDADCAPLACNAFGVCEATPEGSDAGLSDAGLSDAGLSDAGLSDAGPGDAGATDAGASDAGASDAGPADAGPADAGPGDAGEVDAGPEVVVAHLFLSNRAGPAVSGGAVRAVVDGLPSGALAVTNCAGGPARPVDRAGSDEVWFRADLPARGAAEACIVEGARGTNASDVWSSYAYVDHCEAVSVDATGRVGRPQIPVANRACSFTADGVVTDQTLSPPSPDPLRAGTGEMFFSMLIPAPTTCNGSAFLGILSRRDSASVDATGEWHGVVDAECIFGLFSQFSGNMALLTDGALHVVSVNVIDDIGDVYVDGAQLPSALVVHQGGGTADSPMLLQPDAAVRPVYLGADPIATDSREYAGVVDEIAFSPVHQDVDAAALARSLLGRGIAALTAPGAVDLTGAVLAGSVAPDASGALVATANGTADISVPTPVGRMSIAVDGDPWTVILQQDTNALLTLERNAGVLFVRDSLDAERARADVSSSSSLAIEVTVDANGLATIFTDAQAVFTNSGVTQAVSRQVPNVTSLNAVHIDFASGVSASALVVGGD